MRIVYFGNADFGVPSLEKLYSSSHKIVAVVTNPDKPQGRGRALAPTSIKRRAIDLGLPVIEAENLSPKEFYENVVGIKGELFIVIAYRILPERIFNLPPKGTVNLHASLLPRYRGAAPIRWALMNGEEKTGVTTFFIEKKVDTGGMILQKETKIGETENYGELYQRLSRLGAEAVLETVELIEDGKAVSLPQDHSLASPAPKITKELCQINWEEPAFKIVNLVRGLSPQPGAFAYWKGKILKILEARAENSASSTVAPGEVLLADSRQGFMVQTGQGSLLIVSLQLEGKSKVSAAEFLHGYQIQKGERLGAKG